MSALELAAPQLLVDSLPRAVEYYEDQLGFSVDFANEGFYAAVSRGRAVIHLECAPKSAESTALRRSEEHIDAFIEVSGVKDLHEEFADRGVPISKALGERPRGSLDFNVRDTDENVLCFSEAPV